METYAKVRRAVMVDNMSTREAARHFGLHRDTIKKMCSHSVPPGYRRSRSPIPPKLEPFKGIVDAIIEGDKTVHHKQRHTAKRIFDRLREEYGFTGGYTVVREYVSKKIMSQKEMFMPLSHAPGHAQFDFGEADALISGKLVRIHYACMALPHSDAGYVKAYLSEDTEAFLDAHVSAFAYFGGVPLSIVYDNTKIAVSKILGGTQRMRTKEFSELQSHYLFEDKFARPARGNEKGNVEGFVGFSRRNFMVPMPEGHHIDDINNKLLQGCIKRQQDVLRGHTESIGERLLRDLDALTALPKYAHDPCFKVGTRVTSTSVVRYRDNDYSVPVEFGHREVQIKGYVHHLTINVNGQVIARHERCYGKAEFIYNPLHYLALLERKPRSLEQASPLQDWALPETFERVRRMMEARMGTKGRREYIQTLRLLETFSIAQVDAGIERAIQLAVISVDAVRHLILCAIESKPPKLNMALYPFLPAPTVEATRAGAYMRLLNQPVTANAWGGVQ